MTPPAATPGARSTEGLAMVAVGLSGVAWGVFWIPLRALEGQGITGLWAVALFYLLALALLMPVILARAGRLLRGGWDLHVAGMLAGLALVLYAAALVFTDVVHALMFYYLTPLWSTLLARVVIGEAITGARWASIGLALAGLALVLGVEPDLWRSFGGGLGLGDWMGLASGLVWAIAAVWTKSRASGDGLEVTLAYFLWGGVAALALTQLPLDGGTGGPDWRALVDVPAWVLPVTLVLVIPPAFAIMWGATVLGPGVLATLFMTEIGTGAITAAIWANEPFGPREALGVALISLAGVVEPVLPFMSGVSKWLETRRSYRIRRRRLQ